MSNFDTSGFMIGIFGLILIIALFFVFRELMCWYFKINERLKLTQDILKLISESNELLKSISGNLAQKGRLTLPPDKPPEPKIQSLPLKDTNGRFIIPES